MPKAYDLDLRRKVVEAVILNGMKRCEVAEQFNLNRKTVSNWLKRYEITGDIQPSAHNHQGHSHKITDWSAFRVFARANADKTQKEMAELWPEQISDRTISRALKKIGFTRKSGGTPRRFAALGNAHQDKDLWVQAAR